MEGDINWTTIAVSWAFSTATTILIVFITFHSKRCCNKSRRNKYKSIKGLGNKADLAEWCAEKPLKTSSPKLQRSHIQEGSHVTIKSECNSKEAQRNNGKERKKYPTDNLLNLNSKGETDHSIERTVMSKEQNILRRSENKTPLLTNTRSLQISSSATEPSIRSVSIHCANPSKDFLPVTLIQTLTSSPTEKRRQSQERLKIRRASAHTISAGNITEATKEHKKPADFQSFQGNFSSAGQINQMTSRRPPRPTYKPTTSMSTSIPKGSSTSNFEFRSGSNSPPPILLPLTASCRRVTQPPRSNSSISKSLSSDTFPLRVNLPNTSNHVTILNQSDKVQKTTLPQTVLCNSSC